MADFPLRPVSLENEPFPLSEPARERAPQFQEPPSWQEALARGLAGVQAPPPGVGFGRLRAGDAFGTHLIAALARAWGGQKLAEGERVRAENLRMRESSEKASAAARTLRMHALERLQARRERLAERQTLAEIEGESFVRGKGYEAGRRAGGFEPAPRATAVERETPWQKAQAEARNKWYDNEIAMREKRVEALERNQGIDPAVADRQIERLQSEMSSLGQDREKDLATIYARGGLASTRPERTPRATQGAPPPAPAKTPADLVLTFNQARTEQDLMAARALAAAAGNAKFDPAVTAATKRARLRIRGY